MAVAQTCATAWNGLPKTCKNGSPFTIAATMLFMRKGQTFTISEAADIDNYNSKIIAKNLLTVGTIFNIEDLSTEKLQITSAIGRKKTTHPGFRGYRLTLDLNPDQYEALYGWKDIDKEVIVIDSSNNIIFTSSDATTLKGISIDLFDVEKLPVVTEGNTMMAMVEIQETDPAEMRRVMYLNPQENLLVADRFTADDLKTITHVIATPGAVAANVFALSVDRVSTHYIYRGAIESKGITGLVKANIKLYNAAGTEITDHVVTEVGNGDYSIDCSASGFTTGTVQIAAVASDEEYFESESTAVS